MWLELTSVTAECPHCGRRHDVALPEADVTLPYWTGCSSQRGGCGKAYQIDQLTVTALYVADDGPPALTAETHTSA